MKAIENKPPRRNMSRLVKTAIVIVLAAFILILAFFVDESGGGGQAMESPDGKFSVQVVQHSSSLRTIPYAVNLLDVETGKTIRKIKVYPIGGKPSQRLPESSRTIAWDEFSRYADVVLDGEYICRVYVPAQRALILKVLPLDPPREISEPSQSR